MISLTRLTILAKIRKDFNSACQAYADALKEMWRKEEGFPESFLDALTISFNDNYLEFGVWWEKDGAEYDGFLTIKELVFLANYPNPRMCIAVRDWLKETTSTGISFSDYWKKFIKEIGDEKILSVGEFFDED